MGEGGGEPAKQRIPRQYFSLFSTFFLGCRKKRRRKGRLAPGRRRRRVSTQIPRRRRRSRRRRRRLLRGSGFSYFSLLSTHRERILQPPWGRFFHPLQGYTRVAQVCLPFTLRIRTRHGGRFVFFLLNFPPFFFFFSFRWNGFHSPFYILKKFYHNFMNHSSMTRSVLALMKIIVEKIIPVLVCTMEFLKFPFIYF